MFYAEKVANAIGYIYISLKINGEISASTVLSDGVGYRRIFVTTAHLQ